MKSLSIREKILALTLTVLVAGCSVDEPVDEAAALELEKIYQAAEITPEIQLKWARSCALCHAGGQGGAPRIGDKEQWRGRLEQGPAVLLTNTLEGLNRMPPLGYCMDCETQEFAAMIKMMAGDPP